MHEQLIKEIQKMVRDGEVPAKSVAEAVGMIVTEIRKSMIML